MQAGYITGSIETPVGNVPIVATRWGYSEILGAVKVRCGFRRMAYRVAPGLYAVGNPRADSLVFVTANFKLSFDLLRRELDGLNVWIMVLDTKGINVWCAAGKGTFGTEEIIERIESTRLSEVVDHRKLIVPQLGAPGIAAHEVKKRSGFSVTYGPVRANDIKPFLDAGMHATPEMRRVRFSIRDRLVLTPVEAIGWGKYLLIAMAAFFILSGLSRQGYSSDLAMGVGGRALLNILLAYIAGSVIGPTLLPFIPGRSFAFKGAVIGIALFILLYYANLTGEQMIEKCAWALIVVAISSFTLMNFTGASTYTSLSGVLAEMKVALPIQIGGSIIGCSLWIAGRFF